MFMVGIILYFFVFFFFKQKTAYDMRISDWSSDVCSSDLDGACVEQFDIAAHRLQYFDQPGACRVEPDIGDGDVRSGNQQRCDDEEGGRRGGAGQDRKSVV